ncbi:MAG: L,D-transpeptidase family protein [Chitinophagaceae bacterium]
MSERFHKAFVFACICTCLTSLFSCGNKGTAAQTIASSPEELKVKTADLVKEFLQQADDAGGKTGDSTLVLHQPSAVKMLYESAGSAVLWSDQGKWSAGADSLYYVVSNARLYGLFPDDYHDDGLSVIRQLFAADSLSGKERKDASLWAKADLMLTDAFVQLIKDVKFGRLPADSISLNRDTVLADDFFKEQLKAVRNGNSVSALLASLEPAHWEYKLLKNGIRDFLATATFKEYTPVPSRGKDTTGFKKALQKRLYEGGYISFDSTLADSAQLAGAVKKFQKEKGITVDGRAGDGTIRMLNLSDKEKFIRIAITMDKYKKLPAKMPEQYIWVNTSANSMDVVKDEKIQFSSKVISGKPATRTPLLNSAVSVIITYPQWVPPPSIVAKEILPAVKKNPAYLSRKGFSLVDKDGNEVDPYSVDWSKYSKSIPYRVVQGSGDANALGVLKFHFDNKYSVYLHDTNQRYLFNNAMRSLSHGCVRVQEWEKLAYYLLKNDSTASRGYTRIDSLKTWLRNKEKHNISLRNKMPVFIRYLTCVSRDGHILFYDDVYGEDKMLREKYFALK